MLPRGHPSPTACNGQFLVWPESMLVRARCGTRAFRVQRFVDSWFKGCGETSKMSALWVNLELVSVTPHACKYLANPFQRLGVCFAMKL